MKTHNEYSKYVKLNDGTWGVRLNSERPKGTYISTVVAASKDDTLKSEWVTVIWSGKGMSIARIGK